MEGRWHSSPDRCCRNVVRERSLKASYEKMENQSRGYFYKSGATDRKSSKTKQEDMGVQLMSEWVRKGIANHDGRLRTAEEKIQRQDHSIGEMVFCVGQRGTFSSKTCQQQEHPIAEGRQRYHPGDGLVSSAGLGAPKAPIWRCSPLPQLCHCLHWFLHAWVLLIYLDRKVFGFLPLISTALLLVPIWRSPLAWKLDILLMGKYTRFGCLGKWTKTPPTSQY